MQFCLFALKLSLSKSISNFIVLLCTTITYWCSWIWTQVYLDSLEWKISLKLLKAFNQYFLENVFEFFSFTITETLIWNVTRTELFDWYWPKFIHPWFWYKEMDCVVSPGETIPLCHSSQWTDFQLLYTIVTLVTCQPSPQKSI